MILVSACLLGKNVKYSGGNNLCPWLAKYEHHTNMLYLCPECLGNLPIPRPPAEIIGTGGDAVLAGTASVQNKDGVDITAHFIDGAAAVLALVKKHNIHYAVLKARSPSCGSNSIYDGSFSGKIIPGSGVTAALLQKHGVKVFTEETITEAEFCRLLLDI